MDIILILGPLDRVGARGVSMRENRVGKLRRYRVKNSSLNLAVLFALIVFGNFYALAQAPGEDSLSGTTDAVLGSPDVKTAKVSSDPPNLDYDVYYGYVHAHSNLSDGEGTPEEAYAQARAAGMDFFSLADHGEQLVLWPWENKYRRMREAADAAYEPGQFAALYGFEWGNPILGHITVINAEHTTDALRDFSLFRFFC